MAGDRMNTAASFNPKVDAQYKVRDVVPDFQTFLDRWAAASLWARANLRGHLNIQYGPSAEETLDVFLPHAQTHTAPVQILIHGGYWRALSKDDFSFLAAAIVPASAVAIVINYALCPAVTLDRIVDQCRRALVWTSRNAATYGGDSGRLHVTGHSAGAHLAAMLAATDWSRFESGLHPALRSICGVSGLYDLEPLRHTSIQTELRLSDHEAARNSPILLQPAPGTRALLIAGGAETHAFRTQTAAYANTLQTQGITCDTIEIPGRHHYSIIDELCADTSPARQAWLNMTLNA
jgi:arylformamidase